MSHLLHRILAREPEMAVRGEGLMLTLANGRQILDASGGAAVACLGHGNPRVAQAVATQVRALAYPHSGSFTSEPAEALGEMLLGNEPGGLTRALFVSSGSEAMESALKLGRQYFVEKGQGQRTRFIARRQSYHGNTLGALAVGGHAFRRAPYEPILSPLSTRVSPCFPYHYKGPEESDESYVKRLVAELDTEFQRVGSDTVIAFVAETIVGATSGCVTAVPGYFAAIRKVCDRYGALLILDEIMCGTGRTGTMHAWEQEGEGEGVAPDIQVIAKGLGGGYQPIGAMLVSRRVVEALSSGSGVLVNGFTYQAHPVACAAALEVQRIIREDGLLANVRVMGQMLARRLKERFADHEHVGDIRGRGLFYAVEMVRDRRTKEPFDAKYQLHDRIKRHALEVGLGVYPSGGTIDGKSGDHVLVAPPYICQAADIERIVDLLALAVGNALRELPSFAGKGASSVERPALAQR
jgi:adenosylmethionine-8-amino-7-oxononanoate aminotransferase